MLAIGKSDVGRVRDVNQDSYDCNITCQNVGWAVVCDGMGGENGGNIASSTAVEVIGEQLRRGISDRTNPNSIKLILTSAIAAANSKVYSMSQETETLRGMGTTIVCAVVKDREVRIMHAGDSRLYRISDGKAYRVTNDHSVVQNMVDNGEITPEEAEHHPKKRYITRALGVEAKLDCEYTEICCNEADTLLLCSDGVTNYISDEELGILTEETPIMQLPQRLVDRANELGGADNITAVVMAQF